MAEKDMRAFRRGDSILCSQDVIDELMRATPIAPAGALARGISALRFIVVPKEELDAIDKSLDLADQIRALKGI